uniref:Uncharacterized protein n=1 Tax=Chrysotila carterae TaxID=13221 RepID=A0A7S4B5Z4_CHRCT
MDRHRGMMIVPAAVLLLSAGTSAFQLIAAPFARCNGRLARPDLCSTPACSRTALIGLQENVGPAIKSDETYGIMMKTLLETEKPIAQEIAANYGLIDYAFLQQLEARLKLDREDERERLATIRDAVSAEMRKRMEVATETLRSILSSPTPVVMEGKMAGLARQGKVDDALLQLLEANLQQAKAAGEAGKGAVMALSKLQSRVQEELDKKLSPPAALLRKLLRTDSRPARLQILKEKMQVKPKSNIVVSSSLEVKAPSKEDMEENKPEVDPRDLSRAIAELKQRFGNVDEMYDTGFVKKVETITAEAEEMALELAGGREVTAREQQDMMWQSGSVSVWDLEQIEEQAREQNGYAVWEPEGQELIQKDVEQRMKGLNKEQQ